MSDLAPADVTPTGGDAAPDVSGDSSSPDAGAGADASTGLTFDKEFGLEPEAPVADPKTPAAEVVTDPPAVQPGTEVKPGEEVAKPEGDKTPEEKAAEAADKPKDQFTENEKLNWDDDKVPFREEFKNLKQAYLAALETDVTAQFVNEPQKFADWMKETSPTSFNEVGAMLATESANSHPKEWVEYLAKNHPDLIAQAASGREDITAERLKAELSVILDEDDPDVKAALERSTAAPEAEKPAETEEQKRVKEILARDEQQESARVTSEVFQPIETAVNNLVAEAGLEIDRSAYMDKNFDELDEDTQFKAVVNEMIPMYIEHRVSKDPRLVAMQGRLEGFLATKDANGNPKKPDLKSAKTLQHPIQIAATNFTSDFLRIITGAKAKSKLADTKSPANEPPPPMVKGAGAAGGGADDLNRPNTPEDWGFSKP